MTDNDLFGLTPQEEKLIIGCFWGILMLLGILILVAVAVLVWK